MCLAPPKPDRQNHSILRKMKAVHTDTVSEALGTYTGSVVLGGRPRPFNDEERSLPMETRFWHIFVQDCLGGWTATSLGLMSVSRASATAVIPLRIQRGTSSIVRPDSQTMSQNSLNWSQGSIQCHYTPFLTSICCYVCCFFPPKSCKCGQFVRLFADNIYSILDYLLSNFAY